MYIAHTKSIGRAMNAFSNKQVKLFLFNTARPLNNDDFPFDPSDPLACYANCVGVTEGDFVVNDSESVVCKQATNRSGINFKGSGVDPATGNHWLIPNQVLTNRPENVSNRFNFLNMLNIDASGSNWADNTSIQVGDWIEYAFDYDVDIDGIDFDMSSTSSFGTFDVQVWDPTLNAGAGDWVVAQSFDTSTTDVRHQFGQTYTTQRVRIFFTGSSSSNFGINYLAFWSATTTPVANFPTTNPVTWGLAVFNLSGHPAQAVLGTEFPYMWMNVGSPLAPNDATVDSTTIKPGQPVRLLHFEVLGTTVGDI